MRPALLSLLISLPAAAAAPDAVEVNVAGLRSDHGNVGCALFATTDGFPEGTEKAAARMYVKPAGSVAVCRFAGVAPGRYAVAYFHDENGNGKLDKNFLGLPKEGFGFSNNARGAVGAPSFDAAAFRFGGGALTLRLAIRY